MRPNASLIDVNPITLAITWPQGVLSGEDNLTAAAQVHGGVRQMKFTSAVLLW
jgi:hypothetical protein